MAETKPDQMMSRIQISKKQFNQLVVRGDSELHWDHMILLQDLHDPNVLIISLENEDG